MKRLFVGVLLLALAGCARWPGADATDTRATDATAAHTASVQAFTHWELRGRLAVQRADQGFSATLDWRERAGRFELRVAAPLNGGTFVLAGDADAVSLLLPDGERHVAASAEALMQTHLGWVLPVSGARHWIKGVPAPGARATQPYHDAAGRWTDFAQDGWRISILDYFDQPAPALPRKLFLLRDDLQVRLVIQHWERD